ncbi:hypothetical protein [Arthrobacter sp. NicSoilB8]|uniref:hypothetical protein n=1 Tax=Arthrobacter sp. NicSoilB8 TaxID=2830998 RepID=UPI001CC6B8F3|nr:hypothetical protein [Arthrobacter sp. NicSoilB8]BCW69974.1 hypothetical protein NicSoilB8_10180 [Arthrobacter sp. NicSoilB8]
MTKKIVDAINEHLTAANHYWPRSAFNHAEGQAVYLERWLARCIGDATVEHCVATVDETEATISYSALVLTAEMVIVGALSAARERGFQRLPDGVVHMVPRTAIQGLAVHHVEYFGYAEDTSASKEYVSFTATFGGMPPAYVSLPSKGVTNDGRTGRMFDSLAADLLAAGKH